MKKVDVQIGAASGLFSITIKGRADATEAQLDDMLAFAKVEWLLSREADLKAAELEADLERRRAATRRQEAS